MNKSQQIQCTKVGPTDCRNKVEIFIFNQWPPYTMWKWLAYKNLLTQLQLKMLMNFLSGTMDRNPPANAGDVGSIPGLGRFHMTWSN